MSEKKIKGGAVNGYFKFIKHRWGQRGLDAVMEETGIDFGDITDQRYYPMKYSIDIVNWIAESRGEQQMEALGKYTIQNLGALSYLVRFMKMSTMLSKFPKNYSSTFNFGKIDAKIGKKRAVIKFDGVAVSQYTCEIYKGVFKGMLDSTKTKGEVVEKSCQWDGDDLCKFLITWE